jgi:putative transposase
MPTSVGSLSPKEVGRIQEPQRRRSGNGMNVDVRSYRGVPEQRFARSAYYGDGMSDYRRWFVPGGTFFFTVVTYGRRPILTTDAGRSFLRLAIESVRERHPFTLIATVLQPDHWHLVMQLPDGDQRYSVRMKQIKTEFTDQWLATGFPEAPVTEAQRTRGERGVWQPRFWEHTVRDEDDLERCADYIHWNPRKHELVDRVADWEWSSFHRFVRLGHYDMNWGGVAPRCPDNSEWGEPM